MVWLLWYFLSGVAGVLVTLWFAYRICNGHAIRLCSAIPSAQPCYPILGNILSFSGSIENMTENVFLAIEKAMLSGHRAVCFWFGPHPVVVITDPYDIKKVLNNSLSRGREIEESGKEYSKYGLITSPVDHWKITRRHLNLSFHPKNLEELMPTFNSTSDLLLADISKHVNGPALDLMPYVMSTALRTICIFLYGPKTAERVNCEHFEDLRHAVELAGELMLLRVSRPWLNNDIVFKIFYGKKIQFVKRVFHRVFQITNVISDQNQLREGIKVNTGQYNTETEFQTVLGAMHDLPAKYPSLTDHQILEEMISFFATGTDTIGASVSYCLLALACFPQIQDKAYEEICSEVSAQGDVTSADLKRLAYLDRVIKETLRFFTVVPFSSRTPNKDVDFGEYSIPANKFTPLCISAPGLDPKYFRDPRKFDPDRFLTPSSSEDVFMPFSRGPRNCIGKEYAMMLMKVMVAKVVRKYTLSTDMDVNRLKKRFTMMMTSSEGYKVFLNERSK